MVRELANGQVKRSREEERPTTDTHRHFAHHHYRHHRYSSLASARDVETRDPDLETQMEQLQASMQAR